MAAGEIPSNPHWSELSTLNGLMELTKPRVTLMVVLTAAVGYYLAAGAGSLWTLLCLCLGTALQAGGTAALNQYMERGADARMRRTAKRPLPTGRVSPIDALVFGMTLIAFGTLFLVLTTNFLTAAIGWLTAVVYLLIYTPLKTRTVWCTFIGAFPGAAPPLMGWAAGRGELTLEGWALFGILFAWQFPHFMAIARVYRDDYRDGGFLMLPVVEEDGVRTARQMLLGSLLLLAFSVVPYWLQMTSVYYLVGAVALGLIFFWTAAQAARAFHNAGLSSRLLRVSVVYLPLLLVLMVVDKA